MIPELQEDIVKLSKRYVSLIESHIARVEEKGAISTDDINVINNCIRMLAHMATTLYRLNACSD